MLMIDVKELQML